MKREAKELNNLIEQVSQKVVDKVVNEKYLVSRMAVIVNEFDPNTNSASIIIPTDLSNHTDYKYPNRTGMTSLRSTVWENGQIKTYGDKVYLVYQSNNISQGWLESNKSLDIVKEVSRDYLTKADAANIYVKKSGDTMTGLLEVDDSIRSTNNMLVKAAGANARFRAQDTTHGGEIRLTWGGNHQTHGLLSTGYSTDGATLTSENRWLIYRNASNTVQLNDGKVGIDGSGNLVANGNFTANGGDITSGSTTRTANSFVGAHSIAGKIYLYAYDTATSNKGLAVMNNAGTYQEIIAVDQNNYPTIKTGATFNGNINSSGNFRAEGYGSFGGSMYVDGGYTYSGTSTLSSHDTYIVCKSIAGDIFFKCGTSATANKWISVKNNAGTYKDILAVDQSNNVIFQTGFSVNGAVWLSGNLTADGGDIHAGNTTKARTANNGVHSVAGKIYLHTDNSNTGKRGLWVSNRSDTYKEIISVDQNNEATFYGKLSGSIATVTATLVSSANFTTLNYPSGFTNANSVIINWAINTNTASAPAWATGHGLASGTDRTFVQQNNSNILFYNNQSAYYGKTVRVVLMKIG